MLGICNVHILLKTWCNLGSNKNAMKISIMTVLFAWKWCNFIWTFVELPANNTRVNNLMKQYLPVYHSCWCALLTVSFVCCFTSWHCSFTLFHASFRCVARDKNFYYFGRYIKTVFPDSNLFYSVLLAYILEFI